MSETSLQTLSVLKESRPPIAPALRILLADDVTEIRQLIGEWLTEQGHEVLHAATGREALRLLVDHPACDLVITDILMPDGDGLDIIMGLKRSQPSTRILGISGGGKHMSAEDALRLARAIGADEMLLKPFTRKQLFAAMERTLARQR